MEGVGDPHAHPILGRPVWIAVAAASGGSRVQGALSIPDISPEFGDGRLAAHF